MAHEAQPLKFTGRLLKMLIDKSGNLHENTKNKLRGISMFFVVGDSHCVINTV